jgi:hypothetical protein
MSPQSAAKAPTELTPLEELKGIRDQLAQSIAHAEADELGGARHTLSRYERAERKRLLASIEADIRRLSFL